ncbi:putative fatty acyl-CoA reductase CG5065 [Hetaerina americana]|uniref:putative fatty acyl-CoA reductase CG5065 n=1 Tax=Hetaerina americana TaxID=62018 RepID=UPI003A7F166B
MAEAKIFPRVGEFYRGKTIFITGGSGLMGKVLVEKLLRDCHELSHIYILMRPKRGKSPETRLEEMFKLPLFERLRKERPGSETKVTAIPGDIHPEDGGGPNGLGISEGDEMEFLGKTSVVFHCAATLRLEAKLKDAINTNTAGTWRILQLCRRMPNLVAFIHLSTAFCHVDHEVLEEKTYATPIDPEEIMRCVKWMDDAMLDSITPRLLHPHPNTYTFSKRLAETLVENERKYMPVAIVRPSIVTPVWQQPVPGWVDNLNGPVGLMVGAGKGVIRSMHCKGEYHAEVIPVDMAINAMIASAWKVATSKVKDIPVYNLAQAGVKPITWNEVLNIARKHINDYPFEGAVWYPDGNIRSTRLAHNICVIFLHFLPAYFIDFMMLLCRQKRFMVRIQRRIQDGLEVLQYFTTREWKFDNQNYLSLSTSLNTDDQKIFYMDYAPLNEEEYFKTVLLGARQYCMKEDLSTLPSARRHIRRMYWVDKAFSVLFYGLLLWFILSWFNTAKELLDAGGSVVNSSLQNIPIVRAVFQGQEI